MSSRTNHHNELGGFLRAAVPSSAPATSTCPRVAPSGESPASAGLRREEVAELAAISTDYYTRLEQGRIHPSAPSLASR